MQHLAFHPYAEEDWWYENLMIQFPESTVQLDFYLDSRNILAWLEENELLEPMQQAVRDRNNLK